MSRRRGEFEHRTSIFEGAYRAWSHLGGIHPSELSSKTATDLDPLSHPHTDDPRVTSGLLDPSPSTKSSTEKSSSGTPPADEPPSSAVVPPSSSDTERNYPYEPLPRSGLAHPFVQAIISPWLGPNAEHDDIQVGLTTLRTWWQHRRKGESTSAKTALGTDKMKSIVDGYTRHFFNLAHCLVMHDGEQPPRSLAKKIKELEKEGVKFPPPKKEGGKGSVGTGGSCSAMAAMSVVTSHCGGSFAKKEETGSRRLLGIEGAVPEQSCCSSSVLDLESHHNGLGGVGMSYNGAGFGIGAMSRGNIETSSIAASARNASGSVGGNSTATKSYGDPTKTPVVFVSEGGDIQIAMSVNGMTCGNCVKIIETVLKGVNGQPSPIQGILDAAADRDLSMVIIKIEKSSFAKRIAYEAKESLKMVGYDAVPKEMLIIDPKSGSPFDLAALRTAFDIVAATDSRDVFDWNLRCTCPDNGVIRTDCLRHSQMNKRIFEAFDERQEQVKEFMGGCGKRYGLACTCGVNCQCKSGSCCGPLVNMMGNRNGAMLNLNANTNMGGTSMGGNGCCGNQALNPYGSDPRGIAMGMRGPQSFPLDNNRMMQMNMNRSMISQVHMHDPSNHFYPTVQSMQPPQNNFSGMPMQARIPTTPIRTGKSSNIVGDRMNFNHAAIQQPINDFVLNTHVSNGNIGGYTWKAESQQESISKIGNNPMYWNSS